MAPEVRRGSSKILWLGAMTNISELEEFIQTAVADHWEAKRRPLLLATLGLLVRRDHADLIAQVSEGLQRFLEQTHIVQVVRHPDQAQKIGAIPLGVSLPADIRSLFDENVRPRRPKLIRTFWEAFHHPFTERKFVVLDSDNRVHVVNAASPPPNLRSFEILPSDIVNPTPIELSDKVLATWAKVTDWLTRNGLSIESFVVAAPQGLPSRTIVREPSLPHMAWSNALASLDSQDQARIMVPLDIVRKLLSER